MDQNRLTALIEKPEVQRRILRGYQGGYSLGLTQNPKKKSDLAIRVRIESEDASTIPSEIVLEGEAVPILVSTHFKVPHPTELQPGSQKFPIPLEDEPPSGVSLKQALESVEATAADLFALDPAIRSVGVARHSGGFGIRAIRNSSAIVALRAAAPSEIRGLPVLYTETPGEIESLLLVPSSELGSSSSASLVPEREKHRPIVGGLQVHSFDDDLRLDTSAHGLMSVGTLGGFVRLGDGRPALLSNNHVVAGENRGLRGADRILQPGNLAFDSEGQIAVLTDFVALRFSPFGASPKEGTAIFNEVDAGVAALEPSVSFVQGYLPFRGLVAPQSIASALPGDRVFKVGRTTGLTIGEVTEVGTIVGPVGYGPGPCWFRRSFVIEGIDGTLFSDKGDSGSLVVRTNGEAIGIVFAGNSRQTYACSIETALDALKCTLV